MKLTLKNKKLTLRTPKLSDAPILEKYINDRLVNRYLTNVPFPYPRGGMRMWINQAIKEAKNKKAFIFLLSIITSRSGVLVLAKLILRIKKEGLVIGWHENIGVLVL